MVTALKDEHLGGHFAQYESSSLLVMMGWGGEVWATVARGPVRSRGGPDSGLCFCGLGAGPYTCGYGAELNTPHSGDSHTLSLLLLL